MISSKTLNQEPHELYFTIASYIDDPFNMKLYVSEKTGLVYTLDEEKNVWEIEMNEDDVAAYSTKISWEEAPEDFWEYFGFDPYFLIYYLDEPHARKGMFHDEMILTQHKEDAIQYAINSAKKYFNKYNLDVPKTFWFILEREGKDLVEVNSKYSSGQRKYDWEILD